MPSFFHISLTPLRNRIILHTRRAKRRLDKYLLSQVGLIHSLSSLVAPFIDETRLHILWSTSEGSARGDKCRTRMCVKSVVVVDDWHSKVDIPNLAWSIMVA
jgi:hypothetical protein